MKNCSEETKSFFKTAGVSVVPIQLHVTNICNLRCSHCYHVDHKNSSRIDFSTWTRILREYAEIVKEIDVNPLVIFAGGEPILCDFLVDLILVARELMPSAQLVILTNGTLVKSSGIVDKISGDVVFQISLDGPDSQRHDLIRGNGSFNSAVEGISELFDRGFKVHVSSLLSFRTAGWISDFFRTAQDLKVESLNFSRFIRTGRGKETIENGIDRPLEGLELKAAFETILYESRFLGIPSNTDQPLFCLIEDGLGCQDGVGFPIVVDHQGNFLVTACSGVVLASLREENLRDVYMENETLKQLRLVEPAGCGDCRFSFCCGGSRDAAYCAEGSFKGRDPACWCIHSEGIGEHRS